VEVILVDTNYYSLKQGKYYVNLCYVNCEMIETERSEPMLQQIQLIRKRLKKLNKTSKVLIKAGLWCLLALTSASAILAVYNMLAPAEFSNLPLLIQSLFTYGFLVWAELTVGAVILDIVFQ